MRSPIRAGATTAARSVANQAATRAVLAKWPLLLWGLFALLMWFAPALLPFAIGGAMLVGVAACGLLLSAMVILPLQLRLRRALAAKSAASTAGEGA